MPTRVFTHFDSSAGTTSTSGFQGTPNVAISGFVIDGSLGSWSYSFNRSADGESHVLTAVTRRDFIIDYTNFPAIPATALISKVVWRRPTSVIVTLSSVDGSICSISHVSPNISISSSNSGADSANVVLSGSSADIIVFDEPLPINWITRAELITLFNSFFNQDSFNYVAQDTFALSNTTINCTVSVGDWTVTVTYQESFTFDIQTPDRTLQPGDTITVTSNPLDPSPMDFTDILTLNIITLDENQVPFGASIPIPQALWTTITTNLWIFTLPAFLSNGIPNFITLQVTSTQFSGTVDLITAYPIYFFNAPGIYQLVSGETHDTYYDRLTDPISTVDTKIPNPFGKTGFF